MESVMRGPFVTVCALLLAALSPGCERDEPTAKAKAPAAAAATGKRIEWVDALPIEEDAASIVRREIDRARSDRRTLVVYVGATWCEPCTRFHDAAERGELDGSLPPLRLVVFDRDRDEARLAAAGYLSKMIPLFAVPAADGTASMLRMEGSIKGDGAVAQILPRLQSMLVQANGPR